MDFPRWLFELINLADHFSAGVLKEMKASGNSTGVFQAHSTPLPGYPMHGSLPLKV